MADVPNDFRQLSLATLVLSLVLLAVYVAIVIVSARASRRFLVPEQPQEVRWSGIEVVLAFFLAQLFWQPIVYRVLDSSGAIESIYGEDIARAAREKGNRPEKRQAQHRIFLLLSGVAFPIELLSILFLLHFGSRTRPAQVGLTRHRAAQNIALSGLTFLVITPVVLGVFGLARLLTEQLGPVTEHPFTELSAEKGLPVGEMIVLTLLAIIRAPLMEELVFRGIMQPWLATRRWGGHVGMAIALAWAIYPLDAGPMSRLIDGETWQERVLAAAPALFVLFLVPAYIVVWRKQKTFAPTAIFGTSLFFATIHQNAWPAPVPLFVLALGLGWLARRTQSLIGPIVLHALFNGIGCVQLWMLRAG